MSPKKSTQGNKPFIAQTDRPEVKLTSDTPLSELRVRDLSVILAQHLAKKSESPKESQAAGASLPRRKSGGEALNKFSGDAPTKYTGDAPTKYTGDAPTAYPSQGMPGLQQFIEAVSRLTQHVSKRIRYNGGPIVRWPLVHTSFWGNNWTEDPQKKLAKDLNQFHDDLLKSKFMCPLTQYGVWYSPELGSGAFVQPSFLTNFPEEPLTVEKYEEILQDCINRGVIPEPQDATTSAAVNVMMIYLNEHISIDDKKKGRILKPGSGESGYHDCYKTNAGNKLYYAFLNYSGDVNLMTTIASHEFAEMITDPEYDAWDFGTKGHCEIGDICDNQTDSITVGANTWTVQRVYSNIDDACIGQAAFPEPPLSPGPLPSLGSMVPGRGPRGPSSVYCGSVVPLPRVHFDVKDKKRHMDDKDIGDYVERMKRIFEPLGLEPPKVVDAVKEAGNPKRREAGKPKGRGR